MRCVRLECSQFEDRLNQLWDERRTLILDENLLAHSLTCSQCRELLVGQERLGELLRRDPPPISPDFASLIVAKAFSDSGRGSGDSQDGSDNSTVARARLPRTLPRFWSISLSLAAAMALFLVVFPNAHRLAGPATAQPDAAPAGGSQFSKSSGTAGLSNLHGASDVLAKIAVSAPVVARASVPQGAGKLTSGDVDGDTEELRQLIREFWARIPAVTAGPLQPMDHITGGIRPLASTLSTALTAIRRSWPVGRDSPRGIPQAYQPGWQPTFSLPIPASV